MKMTVIAVELAVVTVVAVAAAVAVCVVAVHDALIALVAAFVN